MAENVTYAVVLLVEENLTPDDAARVHSLHEGIEDPVTYHVLMPLADGRARVQAALGASGGPGARPGARTPVAARRHRPARRSSRRPAPTPSASWPTRVEVLRATGSTAIGELVTGDPVDALAAKVKEVDGREAIIFTEEHFVAELLRRDWTSKARRHLDVPVLHLMEQENFDEQAGGGEGVSLI